MHMDSDDPEQYAHPLHKAIENILVQSLQCPQI